MKLEQSFQVEAPRRARVGGADRRGARGAVPARRRDHRGRRRRHLPRQLHREARPHDRVLSRRAVRWSRWTRRPARVTMRATGQDKRGQGAAKATIVSVMREEGGRDHGRRRDRLHDHRPAGPLRARRDDQGRLQPAAAGLLGVPDEDDRGRADGRYAGSQGQAVDSRQAAATRRRQPPAKPVSGFSLVPLGPVGAGSGG